MKSKKEIKDKIRDEIRDWKDSLTEEFMESRSEAIMENLLCIDEFWNAKWPMIYNSKPLEARTKKIVEYAIERGQVPIAPIIQKEDATLRFSFLPIPDYLRPAIFEVPEPYREHPASLKDMDVVVIPGMAFDRRGNRLGYGMGYFDKFLAELRKINPKIVIIALAYSRQVEYDKIPSYENDVPVDMIVTEKEIIDCRKNRLNKMRL